MLSTPWCANGVTALGELGGPSAGLVRVGIKIASSALFPSIPR
jgi:hypothetical protein